MYDVCKLIMYKSMVLNLFCALLNIFKNVWKMNVDINF